MQQEAKDHMFKDIALEIEPMIFISHGPIVQNFTAHAFGCISVLNYKELTEDAYQSFLL